MPPDVGTVLIGYFVRGEFIFVGPLGKKLRMSSGEVVIAFPDPVSGTVRAASVMGLLILK